MLSGKKISILAVLVVLAFVRLVSASGLAADINGDGIVNQEDLMLFAGGWLDSACVTPDWCGGADLNRDGDVDYLDYAVISDQWLDEDDSAVAFITTWDTGLGTGTTVTLALAGWVNAQINWGDGTIETVTTAGPHVHDYGTDGIFIVRVTGTATAYNSYINGGAPSERAKLISVDNWGQIGFTSLHGAFHSASNLVSVPQNSVAIEAVANMHSMFFGASIFNSDISGWDTSNVAVMDHMFNMATSFNQDLSGWCVLNISWKPTSFDLGASSWTLPKPVWGSCPDFVTTWDTGLGTGATVTLALAGSVNAQINWGDGTIETVTTPGPHVHDYGTDGIYTVKVKGSATLYDSYNYGGASSERAKLISVENWGQLGFTSLISAFDSAVNLVSIPNSSIGIEAVTNMSYMFYGASSFNQALDNWDTSNVTDMSFMFKGASAFNGNINTWDTSKVTNMLEMFLSASSFNQNIGNWDTSKVTNMNYMFYVATAFNQDLSGWCVSKIPAKPTAFDIGATAWTLPKPVWGSCPAAFTTTWNTSLGAGTTVTLALAGSVNAEINWGDGTIQTVTTPGPHTHDYGTDGIYTVLVTGSVSEYNSWYNGGASSERAKLISVQNWGQLGFTSLFAAFHSASNLVSVPNSSVGIETVTLMSYMFSEAHSFNSDISNWDTSNVTDMNAMFYNAGSFNQDLSGWCVANLPSEPWNFRTGTTSWTLPKPVWGTCGNKFVTTWDTSLGAGTTVTLALAGTVNAQIDWGDGTIQTVTTPGPHTHDYGIDGIYTVKVTGSATLYDSYNYGGADSERAKLISVDRWGQLGFTRMYCAFYKAINLVSVPNNSIGIEAVWDMSWMFYYASSFNSDISNWDTSNVTNMDSMFFFAQSFNSDISNWNTSGVTDMYRMFYGAHSFNQDLSGWCVSNIAYDWLFDQETFSWTLPKPIWGTCP